MKVIILEQRLPMICYVCSMSSYVLIVELKCHNPALKSREGEGVGVPQLSGSDSIK